MCLDRTGKSTSLRATNTGRDLGRVSILNGSCLSDITECILYAYFVDRT